MKTLQSFMYLMFLLASLSLGGLAFAQDEHGGEAVEDSSGDEHAGDEVDTDEESDEEDEHNEHAGEEA